MEAGSLLGPGSAVGFRAFDALGTFFQAWVRGPEAFFLHARGLCLNEVETVQA